MAALQLLALVAGAAMAGAAAPWNSTDENTKRWHDVQTLAEQQKKEGALQAATDHMDSMLQGNTTILNIDVKELNSTTRAGESSEERIQQQKRAVEEAKQRQASAHEALVGCTKDAKEKSAVLRRVELALKAAQNDTIAKSSAKSDAEKALASANDHLQDVIINDPEKAPEAEMAVTARQSELNATEHALRRAESDAAAGREERTKAQASSQSAAERLSSAEKDASAADATVMSELHMLHSLQTKNMPQEKLRERLQAAADKQRSEVEKLQAKSTDLHSMLRAKQKEVREDSETDDRDVACVKELQQAQDKLALYHASWEKISAAYNTTPAGSDGLHEGLFGTLWQISDKVHRGRYDMRLAQKKCAPDGVEIPDMALPAVCEDDTTGSCALFGCWGYRHAICSDSRKCVCPAGFCANADGICMQRSDPLQSLAERPSALLEAPAGRSGGTPQVAPGTVLLAGLALAAAAFAARGRFGPKREVKVSECALG